MSAERQTSSFHTRFINNSTVLVIEDDSYGEQPYIYVKIYPDLLVITDTGCSSPRQKQKTEITFRSFLETVSIPHPASLFPFTNSQPLNPNGKKKYMIICTHAHYDHILGLPSFLLATPPPFIIASGHDKAFITTNLPTHSLCKYMHVPTPSYTVSHWAHHLEFLADPYPGPDPFPLRIRLLHIPGHTPDSLAWYDVDENHLYVGDTFYTRKPAPSSLGSALSLPEQDAAIIFPVEGDLIKYMASLDLIIDFVKFENQQLKAQWTKADAFEEGIVRNSQRVKVGCGHVTESADAEDMAVQVRELFLGIIKGSVPVVRSFEKRGELFDFWMEAADAKYSVEAPRILVEEARKHFGIHETASR